MRNMKRLIDGVITIYQKIFSPDQGILARLGLVRGAVCSFHPSCSEYTKQAIGKYGIAKGFGKSVKRILRCHPWQKNHIDPV